MKKQVSEIKELDEKIKKIRQDIKQLILDLPDNPCLKRISKNCFTISSKDLNDNFSAFFHDFKKQYEKIAEIIAKSELENILPHLNFIIENGRTQKDYTHFHPDVRANLKKLLEN
jgi:thymidylate kinase